MNNLYMNNLYINNWYVSNLYMSNWYVGNLSMTYVIYVSLNHVSMRVIYEHNSYASALSTTVPIVVMNNSL